LRTDYAIYGVDDGRINIAGLSESQLPYVADALAAVSQK
jgi:aspartate aminotransferase